MYIYIHIVYIVQGIYCNSALHKAYIVSVHVRVHCTRYIL